MYKLGKYKQYSRDVDMVITDCSDAAEISGTSDCDETVARKQIFPHILKASVCLQDKHSMLALAAWRNSVVDWHSTAEVFVWTVK